MGAGEGGFGGVYGRGLDGEDSVGGSIGKGLLNSGGVEGREGGLIILREHDPVGEERGD